MNVRESYWLYVVVDCATNPVLYRVQDPAFKLAVKSHQRFTVNICDVIREVEKESRQYVATTANLTLVNLYWNIGRVITQDIQKNEKRAGYGKQLLQGLAGILTREYGKGFSVSNLNDMRRFYELFQILQSASVESTPNSILQAVPVKSGLPQKRQAVPAESGGPIAIDFKNHAHLGWTHYRTLLGVQDHRKRRF